MIRQLSLLLLVGIIALTAEVRAIDAVSRKRLEWLKSADTDTWQKIPWAGSLLDAQTAAQAENRPMCVVSTTGNLETGRCGSDAREFRVISLADKRVIETVSRYFVPVWISRDRYQCDPWSVAESALLQKIENSRIEKKLEAGGHYCVLLVGKDGETLAAMPLAKALNPTALATFLLRFAEKEALPVRTREEIVAAQPKAIKREPKTEDGRMFIIRTRLEGKAASRGATRDTVELTAKEWLKFLPPDKSKLAERYTIPFEVSEALLRYAYPASPQYSDEVVNVEYSTLTARISSRTEKEILLTLAGSLTLRHPFTGKPTDDKVTATFTGQAKFETKTLALRSFWLLSQKGQHQRYYQEKPLTPQGLTIGIEMEK
jgi:hypothetical protein